MYTTSETEMSPILWWGSIESESPRELLCSKWRSYKGGSTDPGGQANTKSCGPRLDCLPPYLSYLLMIENCLLCKSASAKFHWWKNIVVSRAGFAPEDRQKKGSPEDTKCRSSSMGPQSSLPQRVLLLLLTDLAVQSSEWVLLHFLNSEYKWKSQVWDADPCHWSWDVWWE
jgi:hypothetical protein